MKCHIVVNGKKSEQNTQNIFALGRRIDVVTAFFDLGVEMSVL